MKNTYIVNENGDINIFSSLNFLERYLEIYDIDCYEVFDSIGNKLKLSIAYKTCNFLFMKSTVPIVKASYYIPNVNSETYLKTILIIVIGLEWLMKKEIILYYT
ncbi:hypothetical protein [Volucribacter amazonae]|uniref:Uncharacterized protein n=1 Tax=Volucribacter amazonae TaxID=256731 RepID=A0A9X4P7V1_9PAST|nr:hypothetical protein [Volucribacter amazonae]MDG6894245.1 hypothetical protein [Volucribacter amazonae]